MVPNICFPMVTICLSNMDIGTALTGKETGQSFGEYVTIYGATLHLKGEKGNFRFMKLFFLPNCSCAIYAVFFFKRKHRIGTIRPSKQKSIWKS